MENRCETHNCVFKKHKNISNNGGSHCCVSCKNNGFHGPYCFKIRYSQVAPSANNSLERQKILLSYPRSGNHLTRFFIELLSELPTLGWRSIRDTPIYLNKYPEHIPFNIDKSKKLNVYNLYHKEHVVPSEKEIKKLILIVRNPREVLLRQNNNTININSYNKYFDLIDYYNSSSADKILFFYEDIISNKEKFINDLYDFLRLKNPEKKAYVLENIEHLYKLSESGKGRAWNGVKSKGEINYYYKNIPASIKKEFDDYLENRLNSNKYNIIRTKYNL